MICSGDKKFDIVKQRKTFYAYLKQVSYRFSQHRIVNFFAFSFSLSIKNNRIIKLSQIHYVTLMWFVKRKQPLQ